MPRETNPVQRSKIAVVQFRGFNAVNPGQAMLEKLNRDNSRTIVTWSDILPDQSYKAGNWKITVEYANIGS